MNIIATRRYVVDLKVVANSLPDLDAFDERVASILERRLPADRNARSRNGVRVLSREIVRDFGLPRG